MEYKIGDRVKCVHPASQYTNQYGIVTSEIHGYDNYTVEWYNKGIIPCKVHVDNLVPVSKDTIIMLLNIL